MGSVNSLSPNTVYTVQLEAIDNALNVLSSATTEETTGQSLRYSNRIKEQKGLLVVNQIQIFYTIPVKSLDTLSLSVVFIFNIVQY